MAGDDDQSIYSFQYALPIGLQGFHTKYPFSTTHSLMGCFRCTPTIVAASDALIGANAIPGRIPKTLTSLYAGSAPPVTGLMHRWVFGSGKQEAKSIAESCRDLVNAGIPAREVWLGA